MLATAVFLPIAALPEQQLLSWGWRIPFWISAVVVLIGFVIRRKLDETPAFRQEVSTNEVAQLPTAVLFRDHWVAVLRIVVAAVIASVSTIFTVHALNYAVGGGIDRTFMLWVGVIANATALIAIPLCARIADRIGRKPVFITGSLGSAVLMFAYLWSISTGNRWLILVFGVGMFGVVYSATNGT
nr:MFS transporter [Actinopolyspora halophila]